MPSGSASCGGFAPVAIGEKGSHASSARRFHSEVSHPSMPSRTVLAASSLARGLQLPPCLLKSFKVGVADLGQAPPLCFAFCERRVRSHDLPQMAQDRTVNRSCFCVSRPPHANGIRAQKLRRSPN